MPAQAGIEGRRAPKGESGSLFAPGFRRMTQRRSSAPSAESAANSIPESSLFNALRRHFHSARTADIVMPARAGIRTTPAFAGMTRQEKYPARMTCPGSLPGSLVRPLGKRLTQTDTAIGGRACPIRPSRRGVSSRARIDPFPGLYRSISSQAERPWRKSLTPAEPRDPFPTGAGAAARPRSPESKGGWGEGRGALVGT